MQFMLIPTWFAQAGSGLNRFQSLKNQFVEMWDQIIHFTPIFLVALLILAVFYFIAKFVANLDFLFKGIKNLFLKDLMRQLVRLVILGIGLLIALELLDATALVGATLGAAGVAGIAIGFAFKDLIENYIAGILLSLRQPFDPGDHVLIDGEEGKVIRLSSRSTIFLTLDGNHLRIPNAKVFKATILNYTRNSKRRFGFSVGVGVNEDLVSAQTLGVNILKDMKSVLDDPPPTSEVRELGDSTVNLHFYGWVDQSKSDFKKAKSAAIRLVKTAFDDVKIDMPMPSYLLYTQSADSQAEQASVNETVNRSEGDTSVDHHLDEELQKERSQETDLLADNGVQE